MAFNYNSTTLALKMKNPFHKITHCQQLIDVLTVLKFKHKTRFKQLYIRGEIH